MTFRVNGIGTTLSGDRWLNSEEYYLFSQYKDFHEIIKKLKRDKNLEIKTNEDLFRFRIATKTF